MKWNKEAQEVVDAIPMPEIMKNMTILYADGYQTRCAAGECGGAEHVAAAVAAAGHANRLCDGVAGCL